MDNLFETPETVSIRYIVNDVKAGVKFYTELLAFEVKMNPPSGFAMLTKGNIRLLLNEPGAGGAGQSMPDGTAPEPGGWNRMVFNTPDIHAAVDFLKSKDARFRNEIVEGFGGKQILLLDPSGNLVELVEPKRQEV